MCVVGSLNVDLVVRVARHPDRGETVMGTTAETFLGGKGYNQAVAAARAGARTAIVGAVGDDELRRRRARRARRRRHRRRRCASRRRAGPGMAFPVVDDAGENTIIVVPRANHAVDGGRRRAAARTSSAAPASCCCSSSCRPRRRRRGRRSPGAAARSSCSTRRRSVGDATRFAGLVDVVVPNESELALLTGDRRLRPGRRRRPCWPGDRRRRRRGDAGRAGGAAVDAGGGHDRARRMPSPSSTPSVPATRSAACSPPAWPRGAALLDAVRHANAAGALATTRAGAGPSMPTIGRGRAAARAA